MRGRRWLVWSAWVACIWATAGTGYIIFTHENYRTEFSPGAMTHGHHQIELDCSACHEPWGGVKTQACNECHAGDLMASRDSHPRSKFTDPRNASLLKQIDAAECVTCHREHTPLATHPIGVTQPKDLCFHCHADIGDDRPSHAGMPFTTCANAGCHNFHDNTALYESFILARVNEPDLKAVPTRPLRTVAKAATPPPVPAGSDASIIAAWAQSGHAFAGIGCIDCHTAYPSSTWSDEASWQSCSECHEERVKEFTQGLHGMRLAAGLSAMTPALARLPMKSDASHKELNCSSCHGAHDLNTRTAAVESCLTCHDDTHSRSYEGSPHERTWLAELSGESAPGSGVSCATCHMPRETHERSGNSVISVQHNQNANLRPNDKMIRSVCADCHGLPFTLQALSDPAQISTNFSAPVSGMHESIRLILSRAEAGEYQTNQPNRK